jgi:plasmid rolling circle replication initiator protein Rep
LINGYSKALKELKDPYFLTLTIPNVKDFELKRAIRKMLSAATLINREAKRKLQGIPIRMLRKIETTYNKQRIDFHPHFHLIVEGYEVAMFIKTKWLERFPEANEKAQDLRPADDNSIYELFKYFTKIVYKDGTDVKALDVIFTAMKNLRTFQPVGIKKVVEDIEELQTIIEVLQDVETNYIYSGSDWYCEQTGEELTGYEPSENVLKIVEGFG